MRRGGMPGHSTSAPSWSGRGRAPRHTTDTGTHSVGRRALTHGAGLAGSSPGAPRPLGNDMDGWTHYLLPLSPFLMVVLAVGVAWWTTRRRK